MAAGLPHSSQASAPHPLHPSHGAQPCLGVQRHYRRGAKPRGWGSPSPEPEEGGALNGIPGPWGGVSSLTAQLPGKAPLPAPLTAPP